MTHDHMLAETMKATCLRAAENLDICGPDAKFAADLMRLAAQALRDGWTNEGREAVRVANLAAQDYFNQKGRA